MNRHFRCRPNHGIVTSTQNIVRCEHVADLRRESSSSLVPDDMMLELEETPTEEQCVVLELPITEGQMSAVAQWIGKDSIKSFALEHLGLTMVDVKNATGDYVSDYDNTLNHLQVWLNVNGNDKNKLIALMEEAVQQNRLNASAAEFVIESQG